MRLAYDGAGHGECVVLTAEIIACLRRPETFVIEGAGHLPNLEAEAGFNEALLGFLRRHAPGTPAPEGR